MLRLLTIGLVAEAAVCLPLWIAEKEGFLADEGLAARHVVVGSPNGVTQALTKGEVDVGLTTPEGTFVDAAHGGPLRVLAGITNRPPLSLVTQPRFATVEDLCGAAVGTASMTEGTRRLAEVVLAAHGLRHPADYRFIVTGNHAERWRRLRSGELAAALQPPPFDRMAQEAGLRVLAPVERYVPHYAFLSVCADATSPACREHAAAFLRALARGADHFHQDPPRWGRLLAQRVGVERSYADQAVRDLADRDLIAADLRATPAALEATLDIVRRAGRLTGPDAEFTFESAVEDRYLQQAAG
ncbi:ABC transporter substrate-binding protein [Streptomyces sp. NPDC006627]|uniref:ABC transporter substrate-binding protein n=1 Tax=Streptomyces sp. NPDC006627 TaxID=3154679 RepID=UPI0033BBE209